MGLPGAEPSGGLFVKKLTKLMENGKVEDFGVILNIMLFNLRLKYRFKSQTNSRFQIQYRYPYHKRNLFDFEK